MAAHRFLFVAVAIVGCISYLLLGSSSPTRGFLDSEPRHQVSKDTSTVDESRIDVMDLPEDVFESKDTVNGWINELDTKSIARHAWEIWGALTKRTNQRYHGEKLPVFETWWSINEVLHPKRGGRNLRDFEQPRQLSRSAKPRKPQLTHPFGTLNSVTVKYNDVIKRRIVANRYYDAQTMKNLNDSATTIKQEVANRKIEDFPSNAVMLKPTYQYVSGNKATLLGYWTGPANSTNPSVPGSDTWTKKMLVVPLNVKKRTANVKIVGETGPVPIVPLSHFYHIKLTDQEAKRINDQLDSGTNLKAGDYAILVAMHVSTREIDNWTWQTFWWTLNPPKIPGRLKHLVAKPFDHYQVAVGYSFVTDPNNPDSLPLPCYNPYLETDFGNSTFVKKRPGQLGIESNCMSCHRTAAWPNLSRSNYVANGIIDPGDPEFFAGKLKTDFLWGLADRIAPPAQKKPNP